LSNKIENYRQADEGTALSIARLYQTAFDRAPDQDGLNYWIDQWEVEHLSIGQIADGFYISSEFLATYGNLSDESYISQLYANVLDREPDESGYDYWIDRLDSGMERAGVMASFSDSLENKINTEVELSGLTLVSFGEWALV
ncbi:MAG: DUF4214 domain-containing protein, partial [Porticoccus sp.]|nr:DUF4214 domain-containing protein [Porticoccus sp.]